MANLQYIGARYVPKFYLNPDDQSNDWKSGVLYEALTIVTYNNDSYTSKVVVPDDVGDPASNPDYWACTTKYTAALMALQTTVGNHETRIDALENAVDYIVTPEMFGAVGDGVTDDAAAIQDAVDTGKICVAFGTYRINSSIEVGNKQTLVVYGTLDYTGADCAVLISGSCHVDGFGNIKSAGTYGMRADHTKGLSRARIENVVIICDQAGADSVLLLNAKAASYSFVYNTFNKLKLVGGTALVPVANNAIYIHTETDGYVNENVFSECLLNGCNVAININNESSYKVNRNQFLACDTELSGKSLYAVSPTSKQIEENTFDFRCEEIDDKIDNIIVDTNFKMNRFIGYYRPAMFNVPNPTPATSMYGNQSPLYNTIAGVFLQDDGNFAATDVRFIVRPSGMNFDYIDRRAIGQPITASLIVDGKVTLGYTGHQLNVGLKMYSFNQNITQVTLDLNHLSNYCCNPVEYIEVNASAGLDLTIMSGDVVVMAETHLDKGLNYLWFDNTRTAMATCHLG